MQVYVGTIRRKQHVFFVTSFPFKANNLFAWGMTHVLAWSVPGTHHYPSTPSTSSSPLSPTPQQGADDEHAEPLTWDEITHNWSHKQCLRSAFTGDTEKGQKPLTLIRCNASEKTSQFSLSLFIVQWRRRAVVQKGNIETDQNHRIVECV